MPYIFVCILIQISTAEQCQDYILIQNTKKKQITRIITQTFQHTTFHLVQLVHLFQLYLLSNTLKHYLSLTSFVLFLSLDPHAYNTIITKIISLHRWFNTTDLNLCFKLSSITMLHIKTPTIPEKKRTEHFKVSLFLAFVNLDIYMLNHLVLMA